MADKLQTVSQQMADVVKVRQIGVPCGLFEKRTEPGFVLDNGTVLLESEKDEQGRYIGGAGMDGMYLRTPERYRPVQGKDGKILGFRCEDPRSVLNKLKAAGTRGEAAQEVTNKRREMER